MLLSVSSSRSRPHAPLRPAPMPTRAWSSRIQLAPPYPTLALYFSTSILSCNCTPQQRIRFFFTQLARREVHSDARAPLQLQASKDLIARLLN